MRYPQKQRPLSPSPGNISNKYVTVYTPGWAGRTKHYALTCSAKDAYRIKINRNHKLPGIALVDFTLLFGLDYLLM